jgi:hypothetical protein
LGLSFPFWLPRKYFAAAAKFAYLYAIVMWLICGVGHHPRAAQGAAQIRICKEAPVSEETGAKPIHTKLCRQQSILRLHGGDFNVSLFISLQNSVFNHFSAIFQTFNPHNATHLFT